MTGTDGALAYDVSGSGPLLLAIHGLTEDRRCWDRVPLDQHFRVARIDMRGHGRSPLIGPFDPGTLASDVHRLVAELAAGEAPLVVGHSLGAVVATAYASKHPVRGVVGVDQRLDVSPLPPAVADAVRGSDFDPFIRAMFAPMYGDLDPSIVDEIEQRRTLRQEVVVGAWTPLLELGADELDDWVTKIVTLPPATPYLALHGFDVGDEYAAWLRSRIPGARIEKASTTTHYPHLADPAWFVDRVLGFDAAN